MKYAQILSAALLLATGVAAEDEAQGEYQANYQTDRKEKDIKYVY